MTLILEKPYLKINGKHPSSDTLEELIEKSSDQIVDIPIPADSPFGYYGSKLRLAGRIALNLPPHNAWVEAFCGSSALTLAKAAAPIEIINDIDGNIVNLFKQLREHPSELTRAIALTPYSREELKESKFNLTGLPDLERARRFLISSMMTVNGAYGKGTSGFSHSDSYSRGGLEARVSRWYNLPYRLMEVAQRLRSVRVENLDAQYLLKFFINRPATLVYLDPPYFMKRSHGYENDANDEKFHSELIELCIKAKCMILISGYENDLYQSLLTRKRGWKKEKIVTTTRGTNGKDFERTEVLWKNKFYLKAEKSERVPIRLSKEEKRQRKVNPLRGVTKLSTSDE